MGEVRITATQQPGPYQFVDKLTVDVDANAEPEVVTVLRALADEYERRAGTRVPWPHSAVRVEFAPAEE